MKKILFFASALAGLLLAGSCQQENLEPVAQGNTVTYTVEIPEVATKAVGEADNVNNLVYAVYRVTNTDLNDEEAKLYLATVPTNYQLMYQEDTPVVVDGNKKNAHISLELINDQRYVVIFWAQKGYTWFKKGQEFTSVSYPETLDGNNDAYDAFTGVDVISVDRPSSKNITLVRPFAQLNIATVVPGPTTEHPDRYADFAVSTTEVLVEGIATSFNVGAQTGVNPGNVTFQPAVPLQESFTNSLYPKYISMNYVFVPANQSNVKVSYDIVTNKYGTVENTVPNVPVARNYRTNIIGNLLTSEAEYSVELEDWYVNSNSGTTEVIVDGIVKNQNGDYEVSNKNGLAHAINNLFAEGGTFYVLNSIDMTGVSYDPADVPAGTTVHIVGEAPVVTRSSDRVKIDGLTKPLLKKVNAGAAASFANIYIEAPVDFIQENNGVVAFTNCSNTATDPENDLVGENTGTIAGENTDINKLALEEAIKAKAPYIKLAGDVDVSDIIVLDYKVTIDGCGHKLTSSAGRAINVSGVDGVTIKNLVIECTGERAINIIQNATNVTIDNVTASASNYTVNVATSAPYAVVNIVNSTLNGLCTVNVSAASAIVTVDNSTINCNDNNTTVGESYSALSLNKEAVGGKIIATNTVVNVAEGSDSHKGRNGAENGEVKINGSTEEVVVMVAAIIDPDSDYYYAFVSLDGAIDFAQESEGIVTLIRDITVAETVIIEGGQTVVLDLNGKTLTGNMHKSVGHVLKNEGTLLIKNGTILSTGANGGSAVMNRGKLTVEEVTLNGAPNADGSWPSYTVNNTATMTVNNSKITSYHGAVASYGDGALVTLNNSEIDMAGIPGFTSHGIYTYNDGKVVVNGGTYANKATDQASSGASVINGAVEVNAGAFTGRIENYSGTPVLKGGTYSVNPTRFVADGYKAEVKNNIYSVIPSDYTLVSTADELIAALEAEKHPSVVFANDITIDPANMSNAYGTTGINVKHGQTINGNDYTLNIKGAGGTWDSGINTTGGLIKNLTVTGSFRGIFINHTSTYSKKVVLENVTIGGNGTVYTISCDQGLYQGIEATNCTFNGWTSFAKDAGEAKFVNCSFGEGSGYKYCRPYSNTEFVECTFCPGYAVDTTRATVTFTDCTWEE